MGKYALTRKVNNQRTKEGSIPYQINNVLPKASDYPSQYEYNLEMSKYPFIGNFYRYRNEKLEWEENKAWWNDYAKHTGIDLSKVKYPIRMGLYRGYVPQNSEVFEVTEAIMSLYGMKKFWEF